MEGSANNTTREGFGFGVGELVRHRDKNFRGVIVDAHPHFQGPVDVGWVGDALRQRWHQPWYEVLVHDSEHVLYMPQEFVEADTSYEPIQHPLVGLFFNHFDAGRYSFQGTVH